jgi:hypothetical protein
MFSTGNLRAAGLAISLALVALALSSCGGSSDETTATAPPPISAADAQHLAKLSDQVADNLDVGETCSAAIAADQLANGIDEAHMSAALRSEVEGVSGRLVDEVNCPPPPEPEPKKKKKKEEKPPEHGDEHGGDENGFVPPGHAKHGGITPPGHAKLEGE